MKHWMREGWKRKSRSAYWLQKKGQESDQRKLFLSEYQLNHKMKLMHHFLRQDAEELKRTARPRFFLIGGTP